MTEPTSPSDADPVPVTLRRIQPYQARKSYLCPGCNQTITPGTGHVVAVPSGDPDARRHWHTACWTHRHRRRPK